MYPRSFPASAAELAIAETYSPISSGCAKFSLNSTHSVSLGSPVSSETSCSSRSAAVIHLRQYRTANPVRERLYSTVPKGVDVNNAGLCHVADEGRSDAEGCFAANDDQGSHRSWQSSGAFRINEHREF